MRRRLVLAGALAAVLAGATACGGGGGTNAAAGGGVEKLVIYTARDKKVSDYERPAVGRGFGQADSRG